MSPPYNLGDWKRSDDSPLQQKVFAEMNALLHVLRTLWQSRTGSFFQIFAIIGGVTAVGVAWATWPARLSHSGGDRTATESIRRDHLSGKSIAGLLLLALIFVAYIVLTLKWEAFADYDDSYFTLFSLRGHDFGHMIVPALGRFYPLYDQEFNLVARITHSVVGFHFVVLGQLLILCCLLLFLDRALSLAARVALSAFCLIIPSIVISFTGLVFPEHNVVFWLACMLFFVMLFDRSGSIGWAVAAALSAQTMIYYKETAFLLLLGFAIGRLTLRCRRLDRKGWDPSQLATKASRLDFGLIGIGLVFLAFYASVMFHHPNMQYAHEYSAPWETTLIYYLRVDLLAVVLLVIALTRTYLIFSGRITPERLWDPLAMGGVVCYAAYLYLRICSAYYLAPVDFVAVLCVGRIAILSWKQLGMRGKIAVSAVAVIVLMQSISLSIFRVYERENLIHAKAELADVILARSKGSVGHVQRLFFPFSNPYTMTEFAAYLVYRGISLEGYAPTMPTSQPYSSAIVSAAFKKDELCVDYRSFVCHAGAKPSKGDFVIELPDDGVSNDELRLYRANGEAVFNYEPRPNILQEIYTKVDYLHVISISSRYRFAELSDRWLRSSMIVWQ